MPGPRIPPAVGALLILPIALGVGLFLGRTPALDRAPIAAVPPRTAAHANVDRTRADATKLAVEAADRQAALGTPPPEGIISSWTTFDAAAAESHRTGKAVMLDFNADWCPPCQRLKQEVFEDAFDGKAVCTAVVPVSLVDRQREEGANPPPLDDLQRRFGIDAFPTLVVYSPATGREERLRGYPGRENTLRWIQSAAAAVR